MSDRKVFIDGHFMSHHLSLEDQSKIMMFCFASYFFIFAPLSVNWGQDTDLLSIVCALFFSFMISAATTLISINIPMIMMCKNETVPELVMRSIRTGKVDSLSDGEVSEELCEMMKKEGYCLVQDRNYGSETNYVRKIEDFEWNRFTNSTGPR